MAGNRKPYDRQILPLVGPEHALGPLRRMGRFEWEKVIMRCTFQPSSIKLVALSAATYADTVTGGSVRPGVARLIAVTGLGDSMVRRNLKALESAGFMFMVASGSNYGRGGKGAASEYQLTAPEMLAEQYEAERNAETWNETDQWSMKIIADHQYPSTGDSTKNTEENTGTFDVSPVLLTGTPVLGAKNTGTPVPSTSPLPLHELSPHQSNPHLSVDRHLSNAYASDETPDEKMNPKIGGDPEWDQTYASASQHLQNLPDHGQAAMDESRKRSPMGPTAERVINAATASGWQYPGLRDAS